MLTPCALVFRSNSLRCGRAGVSLLSLLLGVSLAAEPPSAGRLTGTFEGIECEYSPGQEALARALAVRFARHNQEIAAAPPAKTEAKIEPLNPAEMRANRSVYLGRIAALLGLEKPTALQEDCYDTFLANYEETMILFDAMRVGYRSLQTVKRVTVWERPELVRRLESGEKVSGLTYDPATKRGSVNYGGQLEGGLNEPLQALAARRQKLKITTSLNLETKDGYTRYRGQVDVNKKERETSATTSVSLGGTVPAGGVTQWFPVIVPTGLPPEAPEKLAERLWTGMGDGSVEKCFEYLAHGPDSVPVLDPQIAFLVLHEAIEIGIVDHYFRGLDRRWFCDGMANYGAWRVLRDLHGEAVATKVHNLPAQLKEFADLRTQADLRKWPATENESPEQLQSRLEVARYTFADHAVALMDERGGKDILPRLFAEIGKTKPNKVSIKTVEKTWLKLTGTKLDTILADAVKPLPVMAPPAK